ncbi:MAG TPA: hypothetical protein VLG71_03195 [Candidatus Limnocylindria bacterium]|nr:hypothetical protein [Candidatus Limnocylindria bacterium]
MQRLLFIVLLANVLCIEILIALPDDGSAQDKKNPILTKSLPTKMPTGSESSFEPDIELEDDKDEEEDDDDEKDDNDEVK